MRLQKGSSGHQMHSCDKEEGRPIGEYDSIDLRLYLEKLGFHPHRWCRIFGIISHLNELRPEASRLDLTPGGEVWGKILTEWLRRDREDLDIVALVASVSGIAAAISLFFTGIANGGSSALATSFLVVPIIVILIMFLFRFESGFGSGSRGVSTAVDILESAIEVQDPPLELEWTRLRVETECCGLVHRVGLNDPVSTWVYRKWEDFSGESYGRVIPVASRHVSSRED